jgi:hypothetical protein
LICSRCSRNSAPVLEVGDAARVRGQVVDEDEGEAQHLGQHRDRAVRDGARGVADAAHEVGGDQLDLVDVVVALAHLHADGGVGAAGLLGGRGGRSGSPGEFAVHADERLERVVAEGARGAHVGEPEAQVAGGALRPLELDLEGAAVVRGLAAQQLRGVDAELARNALQQAEPRLAAPGLDVRELARDHAHALAELLEREARARAEELEALAEQQTVEFRFTLGGGRIRCHSLTICQ